MNVTKLTALVAGAVLAATIGSSAVAQERPGYGAGPDYETRNQVAAILTPEQRQQFRTFGPWWAPETRSNVAARTASCAANAYAGALHCFAR